MPIFEPSKRDGYVLDLDTAVKDGVLGCVDGDNGVAGVVFGGEKLDLRKMIDELNLTEVPSVFICPISLEPMEDPVTLCTGQTYERSNILRWLGLGLGRPTCPTTMQELWEQSLTPNRTLHHLIYTWFSQKHLLMKKRSEDVHGRASELLGTLRAVKGRARVEALKELRRAVAAHSTARKAVIDGGGVSLIAGLLGPFTSHAVGAEAIGILSELELDSEAKKGLLVQPAKMSLLVDVLNEGSVETKIGCARLIEALLAEDGSGAELASSHSLVVGLMRLVRDNRNRIGNGNGLSLLSKICSSHKEVRGLVVRIGAVPRLLELLPSLDPDGLESCLSVLDSLSGLPEGISALKDCKETMPNLVGLLMRVSESCTRIALSILRCVCESECSSSSAAVEAGLAAKLLMVIQSGCGPELKQRSAELLKLCSLNYTTHTLFISKCKLTRTIQ